MFTANTHLELCVVLLQRLVLGVQHFEASQSVASVLEPGDYPSNEAALDSIRLDHDVGPLHCLILTEDNL